MKSGCHSLGLVCIFFTEMWKEAVVSPVLKKGDPSKVENYRPVSCLPAASKLLERMVCDQLAAYFEENKFNLLFINGMLLLF